MNPQREATVSEEPKRALTCQIVLLNFNGKDLLERFLPSVRAAAKKSRFSCGVTVLDNQSTDESVSWLMQNYPDISVYRAQKNKVLCSYNEIAHFLKEDVLIFLNTDIELEEDFVDPLIECFQLDPMTFFAATYGDKSTPHWKWGMMGAKIPANASAEFFDTPGFSFSVGCGAFDRKKFIALGGYDELYLPGYFEDVDLCYRGWKRGWRGYYVPASRKTHLGSASFKKYYGEKYIQVLSFRNGLLFMIKNISSLKLLLRFLFLLPFYLSGSLLKGNWPILEGFWKSLPKIPKAIQRRIDSTGTSDEETLSFVERSVAFQERPQSFARKLVDKIPSSPWVRFLMFKLGFLTIRPLYPLQYLLLRELWDCRSVLDLGCGTHSMVPIIPSSIFTTGVEYFEPDYLAALNSKRHKRYIQGDITKVEFPEKSVDAVVMLDVLEHLEKKDGEEILTKISRWARKKVIIFTPNGFLPQESYCSNPLMEHKSGWLVSDLKLHRFDSIYGVRGFKGLKRKSGHESTKEELHDRIIDLTQIYTYHYPEKAFQLFAVKHIK